CATVRHLELAEAGIWTIDDAAGVLVLQGNAGASSTLDDRHRRVPLGSPLIGTIARHRRPRWTNDLDTPGQIDDHELWTDGGVAAACGYPLIVEDRLLGVMALFARHRFEEDTLEALAALADLIAQGIERKRLERERIDLLERERTARGEAESANRAKD